VKSRRERTLEIEQPWPTTDNGWQSYHQRRSFLSNEFGMTQLISVVSGVGL
jgi:hypothetical protein